MANIGMDIKLAVLKAAFGICSLTEEKLFKRLEAFYLEAFKAGLNQKITDTTLYHKVNAMMAIMGADGEVCTKQQCVLEVMDALHNIDDGEYQPPAQAEPKLEMPATVGAFTFNTGVSERLVIEAAQRQYEYSRQPEQIEAREERLRGFIDELHKSEPSPDTEQCLHSRLQSQHRVDNGEIPEWTCIDCGKFLGRSGDTEQQRRDAVLVAWCCPNDPDTGSAFYWHTPGVDRSGQHCDNCGNSLMPLYSLQKGSDMEMKANA